MHSKLTKINDQVWIWMRNVTAVHFGECNHHMGRCYEGGEHAGELIGDQTSRMRFQVFEPTADWNSEAILCRFFEVSPECTQGVIDALIGADALHLMRLGKLTWVDPAEIFAIHWDVDVHKDPDAPYSLHVFHPSAARNPDFPDREEYWEVSVDCLPSVCTRLGILLPRKQDPGSSSPAAPQCSYDALCENGEMLRRASSGRLLAGYNRKTEKGRLAPPWDDTEHRLLNEMLGPYHGIPQKSAKRIATWSMPLPPRTRHPSLAISGCITLTPCSGRFFTMKLRRNLQCRRQLPSCTSEALGTCGLSAVYP